MVKELEKVITKKLANYAFRKDYSSLSLLIIPKGKPISDSIFHIEVVWGIIKCHLHEPFKSDHFELLKKKGYLKRKSASILKFYTTHEFENFLDELVIK